MLYTEDWLSAHSAGQLSQWDVLYRDAAGQALARRTLHFRPDAPYQPELLLQHDAGGRLQLNLNERWERIRQAQEQSREAKSWPKIRQHMLVDRALLRYLADQRAAVLAGEIEQVTHYNALQGRTHTYAVERQAMPGPNAPQLMLKLVKKGLFKKRRVAMTLVMEPSSGRLISMDAPSDLMDPQAEMLRTRFYY